MRSEAREGERVCSAALRLPDYDYDYDYELFVKSTLEVFTILYVCNKNENETNYMEL